MKGTAIDELINLCCNLQDVDVECMSEEVPKALEDLMNKIAKEKKVLEVHKKPLPPPEKYDGTNRVRVYVYDPTKAKNRKSIYAYSYDGMIDELYNHYFTNNKTLKEVFEKMCADLYIVGKPRKKTVDEYKQCFNYFFKGEEIAKKNISKITVDDWKNFLTLAHRKITPLDIERGQTFIEKHRHYHLITVIKKIFEYAKLDNPFMSNYINANDYPFYDIKKLEQDGYTHEDVEKLLNYFDSLPTPTIPQLVIGFIFETYTRIGEARAIRFDDFHMNEDEPYVRICALAHKSHREERVKRDSESGKRNLEITPRLKRIYELGKEQSWSDTFIFCKERKYVTEEDIKNNNICVTEDAVRRALNTMCKKVGVKYFPPHQIRFFGAMDMVNKSNDIYNTQHFLGHSDISTTQYYADKLNRSKVFKRAT